MEGGRRGRKRKSSSAENEKTEEAPQAKEEEEEKTLIKINRAPVLTLWVAVVAEREGYSFEEGLTFGKVIAGIFAHSKGRRLGIYEEKEEEISQPERKRRRKEQEKFQVFGMKVAGKTTAEGTRHPLEKGKPLSPASVESYLHRAFGPHYQQAKVALQGLANAYPPERIGAEAYSLYEKLRPQVPVGVGGWGAKGYLDLNLVKQLQKEA